MAGRPRNFDGTVFLDITTVGAVFLVLTTVGAAS
jgi:hypothetical protein